MNASTIIKKLFSTFPNANATAATAVVYAERLSGIPDHELEAVVNQCIDTCEFLPTIAKIKEMHRQLHNATSPDMAAQGWLSVQRAMRDIANYTPEPTSFVPKFKDAVVQKAVEALGWFNLRMSENPRTDQAQFERLYRMFAEQEAGEQRLSSEYRQLRDDVQERTDNGTGLKRIGDVLKLPGGENGN